MTGGTAPPPFPSRAVTSHSRRRKGREADEDEENSHRTIAIYSILMTRAKAAGRSNALTMSQSICTAVRRLTWASGGGDERLGVARHSS